MRKKPIFLFITSILLCMLTFSARAYETSDLEDKIIESYETGQTLDISPYALTEDQLYQCVEDMRYCGKLPWYADFYTGKVYVDTQLVAEFTPVTLDPEQYDRNLYERKTAEILAETVKEGMDPWEIALSVHDYLALHGKYDEMEEKKTGYDLLVNGCGVCQSYSFAYMDLMNRAGVPCVVVVSKEMGKGHGWNLVQLDGQWYHVDVTWDDPTPDIYGRVSHRYFLRTDEEMLSEGAEGHYGWDTSIHCESKAYQEAFWNDIEDPILFPDGRNIIYRVEKEGTSELVRYTPETRESIRMVTQEPVYYDLGEGMGYYPNYGISLWNHRIYYSAMDGVYSVNPETLETYTEYVYDVNQNGRYVSGCFAENDKLYLALTDQNFQVHNDQEPLEDSGYHVHHYVPSVTPPTRGTPGYTTYTCSCGVSYKGDWKPAEADRIPEPTDGEQDSQETDWENITEVLSQSRVQLVLFGILMVLILIYFIRRK